MKVIIHFARAAGVFLLLAGQCHAAWVATPFVDINIRMDNDNGVTFFYPLGGTCQNSRLELRDTGNRFNSVENARRIYSLILSAKLAGKLVSLGYDDADGPYCRIAQVIVQW